MSNNALLLHGRDDHAPLFALSRSSALVHLKVGIRLRGYGVKIGARCRPIFAAKPPLYPPTATASSETWDPDGAASLPIFHERCCLTTARQRPLKT
jgi:hypothetical protein